MREVSRFDPDPELGRFRGWLGVITRRTLARFFEKSRYRINGSGGTTNTLALANMADSEEEAAWEQEHQRHFFRWTAERVRGEFAERTWRAFWLTTVEGVTARQAGQQCGINVGAVYIAKSRVLSRLRERITQLPGGHLSWPVFHVPPMKNCFAC